MFDSDCRTDAPKSRLLGDYKDVSLIAPFVEGHTDVSFCTKEGIPSYNQVPLHRSRNRTRRIRVTAADPDPRGLPVTWPAPSCPTGELAKVTVTSRCYSSPDEVR